MLRKYLYGIFAFVLGTGILFISFLRLSSSVFAFSAPITSPMPAASPVVPSIDYPIVQPGNILPDSFLWPVKAIRDRIWYLFTADHLKKAELALLFADKRIGSGQALLDKGKVELGISTTVKAEKYLETAATEERSARQNGSDTSAFLFRLASASLKHREIIEKHIAPNTSGDAAPQIDKAQEKLTNIYRDSTEVLKSAGMNYPKDPFEGQ